MPEGVPFHKKLHTLNIEEFGEQYLSIIAAISKHGGKAIIFDGDKPVAQLTQYEKPPLNGYGSMKGQIKIHGDIVSPLPPEWYTSCTGHDEDLPT